VEGCLQPVNVSPAFDIFVREATTTKYTDAKTC
jgi:hypothetical protein